VYQQVAAQSTFMTVYIANAAHAHVQKLVSVVKTVTVLVECTTEKQHFIVRLWRVKALNTKDIHIEMFLVYGGKRLSLKAVHNRIQKLSQKTFEKSHMRIW
jgi:hypothetical protein